MMTFLDQWASLIGLVGAILSLLGFGVAILAAYRAQKARDAAEEARKTTESAYGRSLTTVDMERAIALIQRLKDLHRANRWEVSLEHYQPLRVMLAEIRTRHPSLSSELRETLSVAILDVREMENAVSIAVSENIGLGELRGFETVLNEIQTELVVASGLLNSQNVPDGR